MKVHHLQPFPTKFGLLLGKEQLLSFYKKKKIKEPVPAIEGVYGLTIPFENGYSLVYLADDSLALKESLGTIIHESVHVFQGAMQFCAEEAPGAETEAYYIEYIATCLIEDFTRELTKRNRVASPNE